MGFAILVVVGVRGCDGTASYHHDRRRSVVYVVWRNLLSPVNFPHNTSPCLNSQQYSNQAPDSKS